ncbi:MAG: hypothetical protein ACYDAG_03370 [Chloroflexota bacterium]
MLFAFLLGLYLFSSAGHTSSNDEEEMYYMTQGLVKRHSLALPDDAARALWVGTGPRQRAADGHFYSYHQPLNSILAIPFYLGGVVAARSFGPRYRGVITRAAVTGLSAVATAGLACVVMLIAQEIGASVWSSLVLGLVFGVATIAWPYARNFWSEPTAGFFLGCSVLFAIRGSRRTAPAHFAASGVSLILAIATRWAMIASLPALLAYVSLGPPIKDHWRTPSRRLAAFVSPFGFLVLSAGLLSVWNGGTGAAALSRALIVLPQHVQGMVQGFRQVGLSGMYGLLLSPGKSLFLYSPPLVAALICAPAFVRWAPRESLLFGGIVGTHLVLAGLLPQWAGDAAWGPRYMVPVTPYLLLPLVGGLSSGTVLRWPWRFGMVGLIGCGLLVQIVGVAVDPSTYILATGGPTGAGARARWFVPSASPLWAEAQEAIARVRLYTRSVGPGEYALAGSLYPAESAVHELPRWTTGHAAIVFWPLTAGPAVVNLAFVQPDHGHRQAQPLLTIELDGHPLALGQATVDHPRSDLYFVRLAFPRLSASRHTLALFPRTFQPSQTEGTRDHRLLGIDLRRVAFSGSGRALRRTRLPLVPPLPVWPPKTWSRAAFGWFYDPRIPHLVDVWPWYFVHAGLPAHLAWLDCLPLAISLVCGVGLGRTLVRQRSREHN